MILFLSRHLMGVLECHQLTPPNKMVELKTDELCVKNQIEFIGAIRMSRCRFCGSFFPAKPTSTHTYSKKAIRVSRCRFGWINIYTANFTSMKKNPAEPTSTPTYCKKAIRVSRCRFGGINTHSYWKTNLHLSTHT